MVDHLLKFTAAETFHKTEVPLLEEYKGCNYAYSQSVYISSTPILKAMRFKAHAISAGVSHIYFEENPQTQSLRTRQLNSPSAQLELR